MQQEIEVKLDIPPTLKAATVLEKLEQIVKELKRDSSYGPRYKVTLWRNDQVQL